MESNGEAVGGKNVTGTIFDFEVLAAPGPTDPTPPQIARTWRSQLSDEGSPMRSGTLGDVLAGASLRIPGDTQHILDNHGVRGAYSHGVLIACAVLLATRPFSGSARSA